MATKSGNRWIRKGYWGLVQSENFLGNFFLLIIRLYWGALLMVTGLGKWMNLHGVADYFSSLHIPAPLFIAGLVGTIEFFGGVSLFLGLFSRIFSLLLTLVFAAAYAIAHQEALSQIFTHPSSFIMQDPFLFLYASIIVLCFGSGLFSIDYWLERKAYGRPL